MREKLFLIPKPGVEVTDPITNAPLPVEGAEKPRTAYWFRRLRDGDVTQGTAAPAPTTKNKQPKE